MSQQPLGIVKREPLGIVTREPAPTEPGWTQTALNTILDVAHGAGDQLLREGQRGGALLRRIPGVNYLDKLFPPINLDVNLEPTTTAQKVGGVGMQIAEVAAPARAITRTGVALAPRAAAAVTPVVENAVARIAPRLAPVAGRVTRALAPKATVAGVEAAGGGALAAAQGQDVKTGALLGAAFPAVSATSSATGQRLMHSALKPTATLLKEYQTTAPALTRTLLREGVSVTEGGLAKLQRLLGETNDEIARAIDQAPGQISKNVVASRVLPTAARISQRTSDEGLETVGSEVEKFMNHRVYSGPTLSVPEAQAMKVGTYQEIGKNYGKLASEAVETKKALARGLKEEIAAEVPEISALNLRDSELMAALDAVARRVAQAGNRDPVGFAWVTHHPVAFLTALMDRSPSVKSWLARGLYTPVARATGAHPQLVRAAVQSIASGQPATLPANLATGR